MFRQFVKGTNVRNLQLYKVVRTYTQAIENPALESTHKTKDISVVKNMLTINWQDNHTSAYNARWLRNYCKCPSCVHPDSGQKLISPGSIKYCTINSQVINEENELQISFNENGTEHISYFNLDWLRNNCFKKVQQEVISKNDYLYMWGDALKEIPTYDYDQYMNADHTLLQGIHNLRKYGIILLKNCPKEKGHVDLIANRVGPVRNTFYGYTWVVENIPGSENLAYTNLPIPFHQDLCYFRNPPWIQFLHAIETTKGGDNHFVDAFHAAQTLKTRDRQAYEILRTIPMGYKFDSPEDSRKLNRCIIETDPKDENRIVRVNYSPPWEGVLEVDPEIVDAYFDAYAKFENIVNEKNRSAKLHLEAGDCIIFINSRLLHNRSGFSAETHRVLQGTYVDKCDLENKYKVLLRSEKVI